MKVRVHAVSSFVWYRGSSGHQLLGVGGLTVKLHEGKQPAMRPQTAKPVSRAY